ncbi:MAG TPA: YerC/YecD family TrpR-related protein [Bacilli bacterium]|jgi:TrpR-related protein YerC/YecD|nr:TrpR-related protein YerC/YecD [Acholeplasmataceae bacterium]HNZ77938.1 YerC/YecD family TrpR-related protein [Bacilli bacterium]HOD61489.1 YerC/YecD family TrpR-related protein [Bacilli bacterium]HOH61461.1 YerC/YecD family TrpR-related protein [Bacilli bacterium]HPM14359.1 YerC/YecD family TrpR-related protein [Bacilli bacterium]
MKKEKTDSDVKLLYQTLIKLETEEDCHDLLQDLCTKKEIDAMAQRVVAAQYLMNGKTYEQIIELTNISSTTLSRVSKCVQHGKGYKKFIN